MRPPNTYQPEHIPHTWPVSAKTTRPSTIADQSSVEGPYQNSAEGHTEVVRRCVTCSIIAPLDRLSRRTHARVRSIVMLSIPLDTTTQRPASQPTPRASARARPYRLISDPLIERFARDPLAVWVGVALGGLVRIATTVLPLAGPNRMPKDAASTGGVLLALDRWCQSSDTPPSAPTCSSSTCLGIGACSPGAPSSARCSARPLENRHGQGVGKAKGERRKLKRGLSVFCFPIFVFPRSGRKIERGLRWLSLTHPPPPRSSSTHICHWWGGCSTCCSPMAPLEPRLRRATAAWLGWPTAPPAPSPPYCAGLKPMAISSASSQLTGA
jgi:hypothetical protein